MNPASMARQERAEELSKLREECEMLRQRVKVLEESGPGVDDVTVQVSKKIQEGSSQEVEGKWESPVKNKPQFHMSHDGFMGLFVCFSRKSLFWHLFVKNLKKILCEKQKNIPGHMSLHAF